MNDRLMKNLENLQIALDDEDGTVDFEQSDLDKATAIITAIDQSVTEGTVRVVPDGDKVKIILGSFSITCGDMGGADMIEAELGGTE